MTTAPQRVATGPAESLGIDPVAADRLSAALAYAGAGWSVLPVHVAAGDGRCSCRQPECRSPGKHPRSRHGLRDASNDAARISAWWQRWPDANIGVRTGTLVVLDVDGDRGARALEELQRRHDALPCTAWVSTARGRHLYFQARDLVVGNSAARLGHGLDVRGRGGYAIAPPSRHASGHEYRWHELARGIAALPPWLAERNAPLRRRSGPVEISTDLIDRYVAAALEGELDRIATAAPHTRNDTVNRAAFRLGQLAGAGLVATDALEGPLLEAALAVGQGEREARATIVSGLTAGQANPRVIYERGRRRTSTS